MAKKKASRGVNNRLTRTRSVGYGIDIRKIVADRLERIGRTQYWLAKQIGMSRQGVWNYMNRKSDMNSETLDKVLEALGLEVRPKDEPGRGRKRP